MTWSWRQVSRSTRLTAAGVTLAGWAGWGLLRLFPAIERFLLERPSWCSLKILLGIPCLACRGTRSALALAHGNLVQAFRWNPLACAALLIAAAWAVQVTVTGRNLAPGSNPTRPWIVLAWTIFGAALLANWAYVIAAGG